MKTGDIIKQLRKEHNLTQTELGEILGVQKSAIAKYESGRITNLKRSTIEKMAQYFNVKPSYILGLRDDENDNAIDHDISDYEHNLIQHYRKADDKTKSVIKTLLDIK